MLESSSANRKPTIYMYIGSCHIFTIITSKKCNYFCYIFRLSYATNWCSISILLFGFFRKANGLIGFLSFLETIFAVIPSFPNSCAIYLVNIIMADLAVPKTIDTSCDINDSTVVLFYHIWQHCSSYLICCFHLIIKFFYKVSPCCI